MRLFKWLPIAAALFLPSALSQAPEAKLPAYAVVSVKRNLNEADRSTYRQSASGLSSHNNSLLWFLQTAYSMPEQRMVKNLPAWAKDEGYDIDATIDEADAAAVAALTPVQRGAMLRPILEERFHLKYHYETEILPRFALVVAKGGIRGDNVRLSAPDAKLAMKLSGRYSLTASMTIAELSFMVLSTEAQSLVIDRTNLPGRYDFTLSWSRDDSSARQPGSPDPAAPGIFTAVQEQLGLKLEPVKIPTQVLVIDSVERPSAN
jgi:uncharacterized protein (TIGR03435 family)